jgi:hypothetical protein
MRNLIFNLFRYLFIDLLFYIYFIYFKFSAFLIAYFSIPLFAKLQKGKYSEKLIENISCIFNIFSNNKFTIIKLIIYLIQSIFVFYFLTNLFPKTIICSSFLKDYFTIEEFYNKNITITDLNINKKGNLIK